MFSVSSSTNLGRGRMILPRLHIPSQDLSRRSRSPFRSRQLQHWLENLPLGNTVVAAEQLGGLLSQLNRSRYSVRDRLQHQLLLRPAVHSVCQVLLERLQNAALPLDHKHRHLDSLYQQLNEQMAIGYKIVVSELAMTEDLKSHERMILAEAVYFSMEYLARRLLCAYTIYEFEPEGVWNDLNQLYQYAEAQGLQAEAVDEPYPLPGVPVAHTVDLAYKRILMLALAQPYQLMQYEAAEMYALVQNWADTCQLHPQGGLDAEGMFAVDLEGDRGPVYVSQDKDWQAIDARLIDVSTFTQELNRYVQRILRNNLIMVWEPISLADRQQRDMLLRLSDSMRSSQSRKNRRFTLDERVQLATGLNACHHFVSGAREFKPHISELKLNVIDEAGEEEDTLKQHFAHAYREALLRDRAFQSASYTLKPWWQQNVSPLGIALQCSEAAHTLAARVGELVAYRVDRSGFRRWHLGVIRWLKLHYDQALDGSVHIGVMNLARGAVPAASRAVKGVGEGTDYVRALIIPRQVSIAQTRSLVVPALLYDVNSVLCVNLAERMFFVRLSRLVMATRSFSQFEFEIIRRP